MCLGTRPRWGATPNAGDPRAHAAFYRWSMRLLAAPSRKRIAFVQTRCHLVTPRSVAPVQSEHDTAECLRGARRARLRMCAAVGYPGLGTATGGERRTSCLRTSPPVWHAHRRAQEALDRHARR